MLVRDPVFVIPVASLLHCAEDAFHRVWVVSSVLGHGRVHYEVHDLAERPEEVRERLFTTLQAGRLRRREGLCEELARSGPAPVPCPACFGVLIDLLHPPRGRPVLPKQELEAGGVPGILGWVLEMPVEAPRAVEGVTI